MPDKAKETSMFQAIKNIFRKKTLREFLENRLAETGKCLEDDFFKDGPLFFSLKDCCKKHLKESYRDERGFFKKALDSYEDDFD